MKRKFGSDGNGIWTVAASGPTAGCYDIVLQTGEEPAQSHRARLRQAPNGDWLVEVDGITRAVHLTVENDAVWLTSVSGLTPGGSTVRLRRINERPKRARATGSSVCSPMTGRVVAVHVTSGERVKRGQPLVVVEAMKMEQQLKSPRNGTVVRVTCCAGDIVDGGVDLVVLEPDNAGGKQ